MTLDATEFIRRFLMHILPKGYKRIRSFGFLANRNKNNNIELVRKLISEKSTSPIQPVAEKIKKSYQEIIFDATGFDITVCPKCKQGTMMFQCKIAKNPKYNDSS